MKVAYFDYWTHGIHNFEPLDPVLRARGHETVLLHVGSFDAPFATEEVVRGIPCRDISYYGTRFILKMLAKERPDVVITLNTTKPLDRVLVMSCRYLGIKCVYLTHGIRDLGASNEHLVELMERGFNSFREKIRRARKYRSIVIPNYVYTLLHYRPARVFNFRFLRVLYSYFANPGRSFYFPEYRDELLSDQCLVYSQNEAEYYERFGYDPRKITVVGNPQYDRLIEMIHSDRFTVAMLPERVRALVERGRDYALYLEESLPEQSNMGGHTAESRNAFITQCAERLLRDNLTLVVKLHPTTDPRSIVVSHPNCVVERQSLDALIWYSKFCFATISTTVNICVLMGKPVISPRWPLATLPTFFADQGIARVWSSPDEELDVSSDLQARAKYIQRAVTVVTPTASANVVEAIGC